MAVCLVAAYMRHRPFVAVGLAAEAASAAAGPGGAARPLELLSLRHATDPDGTFIVTGLVQNPSGGQTVRNVMAVVYLFDRDGNYFAGAKAALDFTTFSPATNRPSSCASTNAARISRYRVGFRSEEGGVIAHVDRRGQVPASTTGDAIDAPGEPRPPARPAAAGQAGGPAVKPLGRSAPSWRSPHRAGSSVPIVARGAQERPTGQGFSFKTGVELINVTATVTDGDGRFVPGLRKEDFVVYEDGKPQVISQFDARSRAGQPRHRARHERQHDRREDRGRASGAESFSLRAARRAGRGLPVPIRQPARTRAALDDRSPGRESRARRGPAARRDGDVRHGGRSGADGPGRHGARKRSS